MERNFFRNLPSEITTNILSRLPIRSIALSKCVCKSWLNLLDSDDFEYKTPPALALLQQMNSIRSSIFDIEDEDEDEADEEKSHDLHYIPLTDFDIPHENSEQLAAMAANGLLLLHSKLGFSQIPLFICNPITRQYIELWGPEDYILDDDAVVVDDDDEHGGALQPALLQVSDSIQLHTFNFAAPPPPPPVNGRSRLTGELSTLRDCLCYSYTWEDEIVVWSMKEYHVEESWTILYKMSSNGFDFDRASVFGWNYMCVKPIKLFKDGDVLMLLAKKRLIYYSNKTRTIQQVGMFEDAAAKDYVSALIFTPSLFSFKNFGFKNVISF
ncbi:uncharacterized protein LOC125194754 [Salvia hispanica]|uniref:uncharacterized protein LOC125194754 n=1 Tax=Salvia hispanica TaxID=49212 RepID=UPI002009C52C|nr:uncharacterized protein LOC125194754 [Salvia hispanica]